MKKNDDGNDNLYDFDSDKNNDKHTISMILNKNEFLVTYSYCKSPQERWPIAKNQHQIIASSSQSNVYPTRWLAKHINCIKSM